MPEKNIWQGGGMMMIRPFGPKIPFRNSHGPTGTGMFVGSEIFCRKEAESREDLETSKSALDWRI